MIARSALLCACSALALAACGGAASDDEEAPSVPVHVTCAPVVRAQVHDVRTLRGTVAAAPGHDAVVSPQVAGRLESVRMREGDAVAVGDVVATIERQPLEDALLQARASLSTAVTASHFADVRLARVADLQARGIAPQRDVDDATQARDDALAQVSAARAEVSLAQRNVGRSDVRAPIAGVVVRVMRGAGELIDGTPATPVLEIADPAALEIVATAAPADLVELHDGQAAHVDFEALPGRAFDARVRAVTPAVDPTTGVGTVRLVLEHDGTSPPFGLFGEVRVQVAAHDALVVPEPAVRGGGGTRTEVVVCDGQVARVHEVELGVRDSGRVEVSRGVELGQAVVTDHVLGLEDGAALRPRIAQ